MGRGWVIIGLAGLMPALLGGRGSSMAIAIGVGGVLLGARAIEKLYGALTFLADAVISWDQIRPLYDAAKVAPEPGVPAQAIVAGGHQIDRRAGEDLLDVHDLVYRYPGRVVPVVVGCNLTVRTGDRILLEGPSGCGKSTLASLMFGLRTPESGVLLLRGVDRKTLGARGWRRRVVAAPQFHENHILTGSLAFNLLMGRRWPARPGDLKEAEEVCRELGLGAVLDRMPSGLRQMVGETGWQLSHGEKSRVYIARAILQQSELIILDESFASLDPETLQTCVSCVHRRSSTLLVIAHP
jgi:ATP-binding cassette subfamily B protein